MQKRRTFIIEGSQDELERIVALFELEELDNLLGIKVLNVKMISSAQADQLESEQVMTIATQSLSESAKEELEFDLYRIWLDNLWRKGLQPVVRTIQSATGIKTINFKEKSVELIVTITPLNETEIQIFLKVRPSEGKGYLPEGLKACILDENDEIILEKSTDNQSNMLDITYGQRFTCERNDCFSVSLTLGNETIKEYFPE
ncbi:DUF1822 family protein [Nostoc spongiaeforme FACHB-130]|uniref:DUF1822 family protein n=1 Tax=Nostoc spongiaeforme FACHB-130 TaxID=1357510 RepID=A0ABR8FX55_9NOSO|nr:DUF1822 family protein [Nostoc spongiaeforme]MBD2596014.1 DUF1822 family protein [Nostoc spongiaeforme FACHB-130]